MKTPEKTATPQPKNLTLKTAVKAGAAEDCYLNPHTSRMYCHRDGRLVSWPVDSTG